MVAIRTSGGIDVSKLGEDSMSAWLDMLASGNDAEPASVVLVLQEDRACWFRWRDGQAVESFVDSLLPGTTVHESFCPWLPETEHPDALSVKLVLDSPLDEVERVQAPGRRSGVVGKYQRWRLHRHLKRVHPAACVYRLPVDLEPDILAILHCQLPDLWHEWLLSVQQRPVLFTHVVNSTELLAHRLSLLPELPRLPMFVDMSTSFQGRFLLISQGVPAFLRIVSHQKQESVHTEHLKDQSLAHAASLFVDGRCSPVQLRADAEQTDMQGDLSAAFLLASLADGRQAHLLRDDSNDQEGSLPVRSGLQALLKDKVRVKLCATRSLRSTSHRVVTRDVLQASVRRLQRQRQRYFLQGASILCACLAAIALLATSVYGVSSTRQRNHRYAEQLRLEAQRDKLAATVATLSDRPAFLVRVLERIDSQRVVFPAEVEQVLLGVAMALEKVPSIALDHLSWVVADSTFAEPMILGSSWRLPMRQSLWQIGDMPSSLSVEMSGHVSNVQGLGLQQAAVEQLSTALGEVPGVSEVRLLDSPVSASQSSDLPQADRSNYRLTLQKSAS